VVFLELITKEESITNYEYGCDPYNRPIGELLKNGIVVIDKPSGPTSHEVSAWVRDILKLKLAGHGGTLDPKVTGVLPIALENTSKCISVWHMIPKEYVCLMHIHRDAEEEEILKIFKKFTGRIFQRPPLKAAVKRSLRIRKIYELELLEKDGRDILFRVRCQSGTYIRTLAEDMGEALGTSAHMQELRRIVSGPFTEQDMVYLQDLTDAYIFWKESGDETELRKIIKPMEYGLQHINKIIVKDSAVDAICHGANVYLNGVSKLSKGIGADETVLIETLKGEAIGVGKALLNTKNVLKESNNEKEKGEKYKEPIVDIERIFMSPNTYPKMWKKKK
jgi:H/ACA ribonucleoprotein complex subunit 4